MLRQIGVEPPKVHDVGKTLAEYRARLPNQIDAYLERLAQISSWLRKEREFSFYGDFDFIPTEQYSQQDALKAIADAEFVVSVAQMLIPADK